MINDIDQTIEEDEVMRRRGVDDGSSS